MIFQYWQIILINAFFALSLYDKNKFLLILLSGYKAVRGPRRESEIIDGGFGAATSAGNLRDRAVQRATVCRFAQCAGCENSRNAVHDAVSRWVATRHVCYFVAARVPGFHPSRIFLFPATSSFGSSSRGASPYYPKWYTSRADKPEYVDLTFPPTQMDEARQDIPSSLYAIISESRFLFCLSRKGNFRNVARTRDAISRNYGIMWHSVNTQKKKRKRKRKEDTRSADDSEFTSQYTLSITLILSYLYN